MSDEPGRDLLAAEYVLGSLEGDERREAERLLADNPAFARSVATWQRRLTPLAAHVAPEVPPADLWGRIETAITPTSAVPLRRRVRFWQGATAGALAIAASLAAFLGTASAGAPACCRVVTDRGRCTGADRDG